MLRLLCLIFAQFGFGAAAEPLTLEAFLSQVMHSNPAVLSAKYQAEAQHNRIRPASSLDDPFIALGPDQIPLDGSGGGMLRFQISQTFPFPGKLGARREAAESRYLTAESYHKTTQRELTVIAIQAFYRAYYNRHALELNHNLRVLLTGALESTKARYRTGGDASHHDWLLARIEVSVLEVERLRLDREWTTNRALLNEIRSQPPETEIELPKIDFAQAKVAEAVADLSGQPELESASATIIAAEADKRAARLSLIPDLVVQGMAMKPLNSMNMGPEKSNWGVMVGVSIPLFFWRKQLDLASAADSERLAAEAQKQALENRLKTEIIDAKAQFNTARDIVSLYQKEVMPNTDMAVDNARSAYAAKRLPLRSHSF